MSLASARLRIEPGALLLGVALLVPLFWLGAVTHGGLAATTIGLAVLLPLATASRRTNLRWREARILVAAFTGVSAWILLQLVPLPPSVLRLVSPNAAKIWEGSDALLGQIGRWRPITLDVAETAFMAVTAIAVLSFFVVCLRHACAPGGPRSLVVACALVVVVFDLVALTHELVGTVRVYGVFDQVTQGAGGRMPIVTPLMNANHAAALSCAGPPLLIGLMMEARSMPKKILALVGAVISAAVAIMAFSRGGFAVLAIEGVALIAYRVLRPGNLRSRAVGAVLGGATIVAAAVGALYIAGDAVLQEAHDTNVDKIRLFGRAMTVVPHFPMVGIGRGAFGSVLSAYEGDIAAGLRFTHVECSPIQLAVDLGLPVAVLFVAAIGWTVIRSVSSTLSKPSLFGALLSLIGLTIHDLADFSMEFAGVGMFAAALLATVVSTRCPRQAPTPVSAARKSAIWALLPVGALLIVLRPQWRHGLDDDCKYVAAEWSAGRLADAQALINAGMGRHPAEPYFPMANGVRVLASLDAAPFLLRAVELGPQRAQAHYWLGRWFLLAGRRGQAWAEFREAVRLAPSFRSRVFDDMMAASAPLEDLEAATATEEDLEFVAARLAAYGRSSEIERLDDDLMHLHPPAVSARLRVIDRLLANRDVLGARAAARALLAVAPSDPRAYLASAKTTEGEEREQIIEDGLAMCGDVPELLETLVRERGSRLGLSAIAPLLDRLRLACSQRGQIDRFYAIEAQVALARNETAAAVGYWLQAASAAPDGDTYLRAAAQAAAAGGQLDMARALYKRLITLHPEDSALRAALSQLPDVATTPTFAPEVAP